MTQNFIENREQLRNRIPLAQTVGDFENQFVDLVNEYCSMSEVQLQVFIDDVIAMLRSRNAEIAAAEEANPERAGLQ